MEYLYIVKATDQYGTYEYEYLNLRHAKEHYDDEVKAELLQYKDGKYKVLFRK